MKNKCVLCPRDGFSFLEVLVALLIFQVGLLAVAGMAFTAQWIMRDSAAILRGTVEARALGDSLLRSGVAEEGEREKEWGWIQWAPVSAGGPSLRILALNPARSDTLAHLRMWAPYEPSAGNSSQSEEEP